MHPGQIMLTGRMDIQLHPFDLAVEATRCQELARTAMSAAGQPGGALIGNRFPEIAEMDGNLALGAYYRGDLAGMLLGQPVRNDRWFCNQVALALDMCENLHWLDDAFKISELHVHTDVQSCGVGTTLLAEADRMITHSRTVLVTNATGNHRTKEFYRRRGFRTITGPFQWMNLFQRVLVLGRMTPR